MRLLNIHTLELQDFTAREIPSYCILSHRWTNDEVSHKEYRKGLKKHSVGYQKIVDFCVFLRTRPHCFSRTDFELECREGLLEQETVVNWAWIDTCCIDKRSSAELSEAINSVCIHPSTSGRSEFLCSICRCSNGTARLENATST